MLFAATDNTPAITVSDSTLTIIGVILIVIASCVLYYRVRKSLKDRDTK